MLKIKFEPEKGILNVEEKYVNKVDRMANYCALISSLHQKFLEEDKDFAETFKEAITDEIKNGHLFMSPEELHKEALKMIEERFGKLKDILDILKELKEDKE